MLHCEHNGDCIASGNNAVCFCRRGFKGSTCGSRASSYITKHILLKYNTLIVNIKFENIQCDILEMRDG